MTIYQGDCRDILPTLEDESVHCCVTSAPYWALRDYGPEGQIGLEETPEEYIETMVGVFREVRRILRDDGTLWLNLGDTYSSDAKWGGSSSNKNEEKIGDAKRKHRWKSGLPGKNLVGIPWRVALALQSDGWYLRSDIIWHKPNPMPGSYTDRPTVAHEYIFLLTKSPRYFYDNVAIQEDAVSTQPSGNGFKGRQGSAEHHVSSGGDGTDEKWNAASRNKRDVWTVPVASFKGAHFAVFPPKLIEPCVLAGSPDKCCSECGKGYKRIVEKERVATRPGTNSKVNQASFQEDSPYEQHNGSVVGNRDPKRHVTSTKTIGFEPDCECDSALLATVLPAKSVVLDPFYGSGTTGQVAQANGRDYIGIELNEEYIELAQNRTRQRRLI